MIRDPFNWLGMARLWGIGVASVALPVVTYKAIFWMTNAPAPVSKTAEQALFDQIFAQAQPEPEYLPALISSGLVVAVVSFLWWRFIKKGRVL